MNLTNKEALILEQLAVSAGSELYGLQMVKASNDELKMGTIYVTLGRLEKKGFVQSRREQDPAQTIPRRLYKITGAGRKTFEAWSAAMAVYHAGLAGELA
ncbi:MULTISPECIES: PadR family transcriptional regulator [Variovorax]|uniref:PadR family transcriptional regulator n=1 Tax=Variovorax TaxID=34072 RepID=UPI002858F977|nr:helix-turn-helix transcriptional regulator [Variovorax sp. 3319]MDR6886851.1 DNA-binding PadR family transcriptional regulator [Variovorax sp. 3319]